MQDQHATIFAQAKSLYGVTLVEENTMGASGNKIFEVKTDTTSFILRVAPFSERVKERIAFEVQWLDYLAGKSDHIARPIRSVNHTLYEQVVTDDQSFIMCLFEKALGKNPRSDIPAEFNEALFFDLGAVMGELHRLTAQYQGNQICPQFAWDNNTYSWRGEAPILDADVCRWEQKYLHEIHTLPITKDNYGIVHFDIHIDNFFVHNNKIKLFDFYDCQFNWYAADMASAIFFMVLRGANPLTQKSERERTAFAESYLISYLKGYLQTNTLSKYWISKLDLFMQYQMTDEYRAAQSYWKEDLMHLQQWYLDWHKEKIITNSPYVSIDYKKILGSLPPIPNN